ncbi:MAG: tRNA (adenosine(37)-N6)-threonylcarbamoyltransferase complex ATPase subunit type 1 TsaE [Alphaproteobacteria bacterium]|nr:tRNA (adenosine(37)-N6)-threonylcarbamoyltransferase complex ATPase subunit type 1 TsaE [Alphaproteobacteria bacterium]
MASVAGKPLDGLEFERETVAATGRLAAALAHIARIGDVIGLRGPLGAGKTAFARAFIFALGGREEVPSPTFTLVQTYPLCPPVWHFDLYRLDNADDARELGIEEAFADGVSLIEWPERLGPYAPADRLDIEFEILGDERRLARLTGSGAWAARLGGIDFARD